jgi:hypothetical protein
VYPSTWKKEFSPVEIWEKRQKESVIALRLILALRRLLACPDLNLEKLEPETLDAIQEAQEVLAAATGEF